MSLLPSDANAKIENGSDWDTFLAIPTAILRSSLSAQAKILLSQVHGWQRTGACFYSKATFAEICTCSERQVQRIIYDLKNAGLLIVEPVLGGSSRYRLPETICLLLSKYTRDNLSPPPRQSVSPPETICLPPRDSLSPYYINYKIKDKIKDKNDAYATAPAHTDTATADPVSPFPQTIVESEQATEERIELEKISPLKKLKKEKKKIGSLDELDLTREVRAAAERWMNHRRTIGKPIKLPKLIAEVKKYGGGLPGVVQRSIDQGWTGLFPLPKIAPWVRASTVASNWIAAVGKVDPMKPGTGKASEQIINANPGLKEIIVKIRDKEQIRKSSDFVTRIKEDEFFRNRIEKSIKEELTVVLTSGIGGK